MQLKYIFIAYLISSVLSRFPNYGVTVKCPSDKTKAKNQCAMFYDNKPNLLYYFDICPKDMHCSISGQVCIPRTIRKEIGSSCNFPTECISGKCFAGKCVGLSSDQSCYSHQQCDPGFFCRNGNGCYQLTKKDDELKNNGGRCGFGSSSIEEGEGENKKEVCRGWGTIDDGTKVDDQRLCKSGVRHPNTRECRHIEKVEPCNEFNKRFYANVTFTNVQEKFLVECKAISFENKEDSYIVPDGMSVERVKFWKEYISLLEKYKFDKLYTEYPNRFTDNGGFGDEKLKNAYFLYDYAEYLIKTETIDSDGKIKDKCTYNYLLDESSAGFYKIGFATFISLLLLFI